ncbi:MAG: FprA family A-type flavoprotein [Ruminococcus sp.]|nr:FprA family A-type flavoprotein [Ruminococcus sp.]
MKTNVLQSNDIFYISVNDKTIDLFESQYPVPKGVSYNSYVIVDEKIAVMDTVDRRGTTVWMQNLLETLDGKTPDYLIISHMEPDHAGSLWDIATRFSTMTLVGTAKAIAMVTAFCREPLSNPTQVVKEGDTISLGSHTLQFFAAPMVHWPEVMVTYEQTEQLLFSADAFGKFGALDADEPWKDEARRYFINIVGKYGLQVQNLLKKASKLEIKGICPLHGPILSGDLSPYLNLYQTWSSYTPEETGVFVAYASIHGNTTQTAQFLAKKLEALGETVVTLDLCRYDMADAVQQAFRFDRMVLAASSYDGGVFLPMEDFLIHLMAKNFQNRSVFLVENGSWAPCAGKKMRSYLEQMKNLHLSEEVLTIRSAVKPMDEEKLEELAKTIHSSA